MAFFVNAPAFSNTDVSHLTVYSTKEFTLTHDYYPHYQIIYLGDEAQLDSSGKYMDKGILGNDAKKGFETISKKLIKGLDILVVISRSSGGLTKVFHNFGESLRSACRQDEKPICEITTYVIERCDSACIDLYMYGDHRYAQKAAGFGFHRTYIRLFSKGIQITSAQAMAQEYTDNGASKEWFANHLELFSSGPDEVISPFPKDLLDAKIVQRFSLVEIEDFRMAHGDVFDSMTMEYIQSLRNKQY